MFRDSLNLGILGYFEDIPILGLSEIILICIPERGYCMYGSYSQYSSTRFRSIRPCKDSSTRTGTHHARGKQFTVLRYITKQIRKHIGSISVDLTDTVNYNLNAL